MQSQAGRLDGRWGFATAHGWMMAVAETVEQWAPRGVHVLPAPQDALGPLARAAQRLQFRVAQVVINRMVRGWARAFERDPHDWATMNRARALIRRLERAEMSPMDDFAVRSAAPRAQGGTMEMPPVPADWFEPNERESENGVVFYVHGGSFVVERSPRITALVGRFAAAAQARVFAPNYRLAPEHPCPAAIDDIVAAWCWHRRQWPEVPVVALAESAGAAVLLAALQRIRDAGEDMPCGIVLLSPWVDLSLQSWSIVAASLARSTPYTMESLALMVHLYLQGRAATDPVASPLFGDFRGFPPFLIHACEGDILFDDAKRLAERVRAVNGDLTVRVWTDEAHVWERMHSAKARQSIAFAARFIRDRLETG